MSHTDLSLTRRGLVAQAGMLSLLGSSASAYTDQNADAELLRLGKDFEAAWARQRALDGWLEAADALPLDHPLWLRWDARLARTTAIVADIEKAPATTLAGLIVKARACSWTHHGDPVEPDFFSHNGQPTTDLRLGASILRDLLALSCAPAWTS